ncbi:hypothetical protein [Neolewinella antarctica]|uniref:Uncharacterized protein n=1 Tax=Neolewinella antarctica TaxID=442734 RepID=A0ABX0XA38_9BACT|nr:hypothetical protein [Neolewinella antarctica]NJC25819.1 hypothetical protein [Neolewinella antarctica]
MDGPQELPGWLKYAGWLPLVIYFGLKYLVIGPENLTQLQGFILLGAAVLAHLAVWKYRKSFNPQPKDPNDGTHPER